VTQGEHPNGLEKLVRRHGVFKEVKCRQCALEEELKKFIDENARLQVALKRINTKAVDERNRMNLRPANPATFLEIANIAELALKGKR
jgi:hypothetical protein